MRDTMTFLAVLRFQAIFGGDPDREILLEQSLTPSSVYLMRPVPSTCLFDETSPLDQARPDVLPSDLNLRRLLY